MKRTGFSGYVYDFSVYYDATDIDDVKDIHEYLVSVFPRINNFIKFHKCIECNSVELYFNEKARM